MANCLGLYIEENLIKYAKVSKDHNDIKVEAYGIKFYDKIGPAIDQIIQETYSQKTPISVNLSEEMYNYFDMFALLSKNDLNKAIKTEFDFYCADKSINPNVFETRFAVINNLQEKEKIKVIHIAENKIELNKRIQEIEGYELKNVSPISMSITNLIDTNIKQNCLIINIEKETTVTTILENKVYDITKIEEGSQDFLEKINLKENSYSKSYEICKNSTIYTSKGAELQQEQTVYLQDIMPTLYSIVGKVKKIINTTPQEMERIYITGTGALINNIDLYFQEYLSEVECEILKPYFIDGTRDINIKDYIEVNSAISLAMMQLGEGIEGMNFKKPAFGDKLPSWLKIDIAPEKSKKEKKNSGGFFTWDLGQKLDKTEKSLIRVCSGLFLLVVIYSAFSAVLANQMNIKKEEAQNSINNTQKQIQLANEDNQKILSKANSYTSLIKSLENANNKITDRNKTRNAIPNLLNQIMSVIPAKVQLTSIETTSNTHVIITAKSTEYEQLGFFIAKIKNDVILTNVISTSGQKDSDVVTIKIEGDLP